MSWDKTAFPVVALLRQPLHNKMNMLFSDNALVKTYATEIRDTEQEILKIYEQWNLNRREIQQIHREFAREVKNLGKKDRTESVRVRVFAGDS
ncbi:MAG: hypothetical protein LBR51_01595 [Bacteroidales bacterium]|jgi:hypothetical protein|nr:hypothetical protein [Bacteroidales bacterium]